MIFSKKLLFVLLLSLPAVTYGQNGYLNIDITRDAQGSVLFYTQNSSSDRFHITIEFTKLVNLRCDCGMIFDGNVGQGRTRLFKLVKDQNIGGVDYDYRWTFRKGWANPKVKEDVVYMIPAASGNTVTTIGMKDIKETIEGDEEGEEEKVSDTFYSIGFKMNEGDTVFAARRGVVEKIIDGQEAEGKNLTFSKKVNSIVIRHKDNTEGSYSVLRNRSFFVQPGDKIEAGQPLAIVGGENYTSGTHVRFRVYYLEYDKSKLSERYRWMYLRPKFTTEHYDNIELEANSDYTSLHTQSLILQEWNKRELKKRGKKKKKK